MKSDPRTVASLKSAVAYVMSLSEADMVALVPTQSGIYFTTCPNCHAGTQDNAPWEWDPRRPHEIRCKGCGAVYPDNPKYPDNQFVEVAGPTGPQKYYYYERPNDHYRIYFRAHADYRAREYMETQCRDLAELYAATGDEVYARRAALILLRFAAVYPGYAYHFDYPFRPKVFAPWTQNRIPGTAAYRTAKWSWWAYMDISLNLLRAYDAIREWPGLSKLDPAATSKIENDLFAGMVGFVLGFDETYSNMSPGMWRDVIYAGRVLHRPEWIHEAVRRFEHFLATRFLYDGHWMEPAPSYCSQVIGGLQVVMDAVAGYSDPDGYTDAKDGRHFADMDLKKSVPQYAAAIRALEAPRLPDGRLLPVNDTWSFNARRPRTTTEPVLLPGFGVAVLGGGSGADQVHCFLDFTSGTGHKHDSALGIGLFAHGKELLPDIGYTHTKYRCWCISTVSHNTVVVNGRESQIDANWTGNRLVAYAAADPGFQVAAAESTSAYPDITSLYRRTLIIVGADTPAPYLVDVFQVTGGEEHDYLLHGSADDDCKASLDGAALTPFAGTLMNRGVKFTAPRGESDGVGPEGGYGFVKDLRTGPATSSVTLDMTVSGTPAIGVRTLLLCEPQTTVYLGEAPSVRRAKEHDDQLDDFQTPFFCARRTGAGLHSTFVAVHEPYQGEPEIRLATVQRLPDAVLLTITHDSGARDYVIVGLSGAAAVNSTTPDGPLTFTGRYGLAQSHDGKPVDIHAVEASELTLGTHRLTGRDGWTGAVQGIGFDSATATYWIDLDAPVDCATPTAMIVRFADGTERAFTVTKTEPHGTGTRVTIAEQPGFTVGEGKVELTSFPQRTIAGAKVTFGILSQRHGRA